LTNRKQHNSILVLATLGVYFGLVLVGASPQILAQAAMTRSFDIHDEIEFKDDLDKKPDDERSEVTDSVQIYLEDVEYFLASLGRLQNKGKFNAAKDTFNVVQTSLLPCVDSNAAGRYTPIRFESSNSAARSALDQFTRGMAYGYSLGDCVENVEFKVAAADSRYDLRLDDNGLTVNVSVKKRSSQRAFELIRELDSIAHLYAAEAKTGARHQIVTNTAFRSDNDQVFVVTRLPRAGLDALLAIDAK